MNRHRLSTFSLPSDVPTFWQSAEEASLSFTIKQLDVSILDALKWTQAYVALSFCLPEVTFHWAEPTDRSVEDEIPDDEVELLLIKGWRTDTEGDFLGILFGEVCDGHLSSITDQMLVLLTRVLNDLPLEILSHCDEKSETTMLARTLEPHLLWSTCMKLKEGSYYLPSRGAYLSIDVSDLSTWDPLIRRVPIRETSEEAEEEEEEETKESDHLQYTEEEETSEEEESGAESDGPDYQESKGVESEVASSGRVESEEEEGGSGESSGPSELSREEREAVAERKRAAAEGKRPIEESGGPPLQLLQGDPTLNPEPPREETKRN
ncbi:hypothetical protein CBR_g29749 [Chara braunii]|uniref:Uncharacterized protein n=1 Tax=Chara braunii TaxID=69332 RepID=A0A388LBB7_CHABU|nr:hypothetical protein CBR_g29749 [Chara braunii]|eukprot:GBG79601.1 hypothetical protein CBR_g29749 [Chara braunii]